MTNGGAFARARAVIAGGVDSPVRAGAPVGGDPIVAALASGAEFFDVEGRRYVDYLMAYGPLLFGHAHPALSVGLDALAQRGTLYGSTHLAEVALAERIRGHLPSMERLRFCSSGTEAVMGAVRVARAFTRRSTILKFAGNYHGHSDLALLDAGASAQTTDAGKSGIPASVTRDVRVARYNDLADTDRVLAEIGDDLAAIIVEPIVGNMGLVFAVPGFLEGLAERAAARGALLICDEVITWLRVGLTGAQGRLGIAPDLTTLGKILGGGFPFAAFGGRADVMAVLAPDGETFAGGTHAGYAFGVALAERVLTLLEAHPEWYPRMDALAKRLAAGLERGLRAHDLDFAVLQYESIVDFKFRSGPPTRNYDDARRADRRAFAAYYHAMRERGVLLAPSSNEVMFLSTEHTQAQIDETIAAHDASLAHLRDTGLV